MEETYMDITDWKKPAWKGYILYDLDCVTFWERQTYVDNSGLLVVREWGGKGRSE